MSDRPARPLLAVKQQVPPVRDGAVRRERLERLLTPPDAVDRRRGARRVGQDQPAQRVGRDGGDARRVAWVSLDESDDEPRAVLELRAHGVVRAGRRPRPAPLEALAAEVPVVDLALPMLLNELAASPPRTCWCSTTTT